MYLWAHWMVADAVSEQKAEEFSLDVSTWLLQVLNYIFLEFLFNCHCLEERASSVVLLTKRDQHSQVMKKKKNKSPNRLTTKVLLLKHLNHHSSAFPVMYITTRQ